MCCINNIYQYYYNEVGKCEYVIEVVTHPAAGVSQINLNALYKSL